MIQGNGGVVHDNISDDRDERRKRNFVAAVEQLKRLVALGQNCQVIFDITSGGTIKAKITHHIDLNTETKSG